jgi:uncharacterized protein YdeI (YjbR/CyaY-like superfamily)
MKALFFSTSAELRTWFEKNHDKETEILIGFYKVGSGKKSITWSESVDQALCFGWIDGVRKSIDQESYMIRFTPRKANSTWSAVNIKKIEELVRQGLMKAEGLEAFNKRKEANSKIYSYEKEPVVLEKSYAKKLKANKEAWIFFQSQPLSYRKTATDWVMRAKQEATRLSRLAALINDSEAGMKVKPFRY